MLHEPAGRCVCGEYLVCPTTTDNAEMAIVNRLLREHGLGPNRGSHGVRELITYYEQRLAELNATQTSTLLDDR